MTTLQPQRRQWTCLSPLVFGCACMKIMTNFNHGMAEKTRKSPSPAQHWAFCWRAAAPPVSVLASCFQDRWRKHKHTHSVNNALSPDRPSSGWMPLTSGWKHRDGVVLEDRGAERTTPFSLFLLLNRRQTNPTQNPPLSTVLKNGFKMLTRLCWVQSNPEVRIYEHDWFSRHNLAFYHCRNKSGKLD